jgi:hypothetical protein
MVKTTTARVQPSGNQKAKDASWAIEVEAEVVQEVIEDSCEKVSVLERKEENSERREWRCF